MMNLAKAFLPRSMLAICKDCKIGLSFEDGCVFWSFLEETPLCVATLSVWNCSNSISNMRFTTGKQVTGPFATLSTNPTANWVVFEGCQGAAVAAAGRGIIVAFYLLLIVFVVIAFFHHFIRRLWNSYRCELASFVEAGRRHEAVG
jgi:hypothetical protein